MQEVIRKLRARISSKLSSSLAHPILPSQYNHCFASFQEQISSLVYNQTFSDVAVISGFEFCRGRFFCLDFFFKDFADTTILHMFSCINGLPTEVNTKTPFHQLSENTHCSI